MKLNNLLEIAAFSSRFPVYPNDGAEHLPFVAWVIKEVAPSMFVELANGVGNLYFACCDSVSEAGLATKCFAVNSLVGYENLPNYDETVATAQAINRARYAEFSQLLQITFDEALSNFSDGSIGLLHIHRLGTNESITQTLERWLPKLTLEAVVMISGINAHELRSKEGKVWDDIQIRYPRNILFPHMDGMGVFQLNDAPTDKVMDWLRPNSAEKQPLINYFEFLGKRLLEKNEFGLLNAQLLERDKQIDRLTEIISERDLSIAERDQAVAGNDGQILALKQLITKLSIEITRIIQSKSWKITKPLRTFRRKLDDQQKNYSDDQNLTTLLKSEIVQKAALSVVSLQNLDYVPLLKNNLQLNKAAKVLIFHNQKSLSDPENCTSDLDGSNVRLSEKNICSRPMKSVGRDQIKLAKLYGIEGICFHCYWSENKQHPETEINNYLKNTDLDLPFCSSWAFESWEWQSDTEGYTARDSKQPTKTEDIAFIQHISAYFNDPRHIRIGKKPLLLVDFPDLQPSVQEIVKNWRNWCKEEGVGEIYLGFMGTLGTLDPIQYGFDAAIEKPQACLPLARDINPSQPNKNINFLHHEGDGSLVRSRKCDKPAHKLFRTVCPITGDTTIDSGKTLPMAYQEWLFNAINDKLHRFDNRDERIVMVNPWNIYSVNDFLEPDPHYGFAYLEATCMAIVRSAAINCPSAFDDKKPIAVVIHAFYETILDEILSYLDAISTVPLKLYVTASVELFETAQCKLKRHRHGFYLLPVSNRGRDILPFLKIMPEVIAGGHDVLIKIHTKKSIHREDGDVWRKDVFDKLLSEQAIKANISHLSNNTEVGILGPNDHIVPIDGYKGANAVRMTQLAARMGIDNGTLEKLNFVAGSMFIARTNAVIPLMNIALSETDFEAEAGQLDGTLAHSLERIFPVSAFSVGLTTCSPDNSVTKNYQFTNKSVDFKRQSSNLAEN